VKRTAPSLAADVFLIVLVTLVAYLPAFQNGFIVDDVFITKNELIRASDGLHRIWFTTEAQDYFPVTWSAWWMQWHLWGNDPMGYHVVTVALHAANAVLVGLVLRRLKIPGAWFAAMVFALHPVNVATAAWITEQKNTFSLFFGGLAALLYLRFDDSVAGPRGACPERSRRVAVTDAPQRVPIERHPTSGSTLTANATESVPSWIWFCLSLVAFLLALLSKAAIVMLPFALLGFVWWRRGKVRVIDLILSLPFFALSLIFGFMNIWFHHQHVLTKISPRLDGFLSRLLMAGWIPWFYLSKALWPVNLTFVYPKWDSDPGRWLSYIPGAILVACFALFWWKRKSWGRPLLFGLGYFVVMMFPVLGFFDHSFYRITVVADHWQYYSIVGVIALVGAFWQGLCDQMSRQLEGRVGRRLDIGSLVSVALLASLGAATWVRAGVYRDHESLYRDNVAKNPGAWMAHYNLGLNLWRDGRVDEAITAYRQTLRLKSDFTEVHNNLGVALVAAGDVNGAITEFQEALRLSPDNAEAHNNLGMALARQGQIGQAITNFEQAVKLNPGYVTAHANLAKALAQVGRTQDAIQQYEQVLKIQPNYPGVQHDLLAAQESLKHANPQLPPVGGSQ